MYHCLLKVSYKQIKPRKDRCQAWEGKILEFVTREQETVLLKGPAYNGLIKM